MHTEERTGNIQDIEFRVVYSGRRTLGISVLPDSSVIVRVPYRTTDKTIRRIVEERSIWIKKHRDTYKEQDNSILTRIYANGETHLFRGMKVVLKIEKSSKPYYRYYEGTIELGLSNTDDQGKIKILLYDFYKRESKIIFPVMFSQAMIKYESQMFNPTGLIIRSMKRRWGSCSGKGIITLSTELIKLPDIFIEYVIVHELCHLKHHNHGSRYYELLTRLFPEWKSVRKELRKYIR